MGGGPYARPYLGGRKFTLIADCATITWFFKSQSLSLKLHMCGFALKLMRFCRVGQELATSSGVRLAGLPRLESPGENVDNYYYFPGDSSSKQTLRKPEGPIFEGVLLSELSAEGLDATPMENIYVAAGVVISLTEPCPWVINPETGCEYLQQTLTPVLPLAVDVSCGGGGRMLAARWVVHVLAAVKHAWRACECVWKNGTEEGARLLRTPGTVECRAMPEEVRPNVVIGYTRRKLDETEDTCEAASGNRSAFVDSRAVSLQQRF